MSTATLRLQYRAISHKISSTKVVRVRWKLIYVVATLLCVAMLGLYIYRVNELTQGAYLIKNYNQEINSLSLQNGDLQANFAQSAFLGQVMQKSQALGFEKITNIAYVQVLQNSLAVAK